MDVDKQALRRLRRVVWAHYRAHGRHDLPWRTTTNPYRILVSEIMLQQTQVDRVVPKYKAFLKEFPTVRALAVAPLARVLVAWQGLGYNRRAKALHDTAKDTVARHAGRVPRAYDELVALPGIGPYTAGAVCVFAYNTPLPLLETNIRTVLFHHLLATRVEVSDQELLQLTVVLLDRKRSREWYWALMDYGAHLKRNGIRVNSQSKHYVKQSPFKGSDREIRGAILRHLLDGPKSLEVLRSSIRTNHERVVRQLEQLEKEALVTCTRGRYRIR